MVYAHHVFRGSSGRNAALIFEGKTSDVRTWGHARRRWIDDSKELTNVTDCSMIVVLTD